MQLAAMKQLSHLGSFITINELINTFTQNSSIFSVTWIGKIFTQFLLEKLNNVT